MRNDPLADVLSNIMNAEKIGRNTVASKPFSTVIGRILDLMKTKGYIAEYTVEDDKKGGIVTITLKGSINKCGVIKPRYSVQTDNFQKFEERYLPAKDFGILFVSTSQGIMTHNDAKEKKIGGSLLGYCY